MRRRQFIALVGSAVGSWPVAVRAQQAGKLPTIGFLGADPTAFSPWTNAFVARLRELGWIENRTIAIEYRWSEGRMSDRMSILLSLWAAPCRLYARRPPQFQSSLRSGSTRSAVGWSRVWPSRAVTSPDSHSKQPISPASG